MGRRVRKPQVDQHSAMLTARPPVEDDPKSPICGMPVLQVWKAGTVMFIKRSLERGVGCMAADAAAHYEAAIVVCGSAFDWTSPPR